MSGTHDDVFDDAAVRARAEDTDEIERSLARVTMTMGDTDEARFDAEIERRHRVNLAMAAFSRTHQHGREPRRRGR